MTTITLERAFMIRVLEQLDVAQALLERSQHHAKMAAMYEELRAALAPPATAPEPVAWMSPKRFYRTRAMALTNGEQLIEPLYLHPPATAPAQPALERKPMTDEEVIDLVRECGLDWHKGFMPLFDDDPTNRFAVLVRAVEASHDIKDAP
jgi:hypothetical protein